jgi:hypothetical protein
VEELLPRGENGRENLEDVKSGEAAEMETDGVVGCDADE